MSAAGPGSALQPPEGSILRDLYRRITGSGSGLGSKEAIGLDHALCRLAGYETTENGRGHVMRRKGESRWLSMYRPLYYQVDALGLITQRLPGYWLRTQSQVQRLLAGDTRVAIYQEGETPKYERGNGLAHALCLAFVAAVGREQGVRMPKEDK